MTTKAVLKPKGPGFFGACLLLLMALPLLAQDPSEKGPADKLKTTMTGDEILAMLKDRQYPESMEAQFKMTLVDKAGKKQEREYKVQRYKNNVLIEFMVPDYIKNTRYLLIKDDEEKQQIYVYFPPPTDDYREIDPGGDGDDMSFLGSDFDITDFQVKDPGKTVNKLQRIDVKGGELCYVVKSETKGPDYKYSKTISWIRKDCWIPIRIKFFNKKGNVKKDMKVYNLRDLGDRKVISKVGMEDVQTGHKTILELKNARLDVKFPEDHFTVDNLKEM